jgi:hypothetical protein
MGQPPLSGARRYVERVANCEGDCGLRPAEYLAGIGPIG